MDECYYIGFDHPTKWQLEEYRRVFNACIRSVFRIQDEIDKLEAFIAITNDDQAAMEVGFLNLALSREKARARHYDNLVFKLVCGDPVPWLIRNLNLKN